jgi:hypothetical protein
MAAVNEGLLLPAPEDSERLRNCVVQRDRVNRQGHALRRGP